MFSPHLQWPIDDNQNELTPNFINRNYILFIGDLQSAYEYTTELLNVSPNSYHAEISLHHHKSIPLETLETQNKDQEKNVVI